MTAGAVSAAGLLQVKELLAPFKDPTTVIPGAPPVDEPDPGKPETIMALGTDGRLGEDIGQRSDTILLARLDAENRVISLMSIPRDLRVAIPGYGIGKMNAAYSYGGAKLTIETVKALLSTPGHPFKINHVVEVNFTGFRDLVNYLGCVYVDVDRHYFNDVGGPLGYAVIDIDKGYQRLCGDDALSYVRYRHTDSDLVRGARQQDFLRQLLRSKKVGTRLTFGNREQLVKLAARFLRTDRGLTRSTKQLFSLLKLGLAVKAQPVQQIPFAEGRIGYSLINGESFVEAPADAVADTVDRFLNPPEPKPRQQQRSAERTARGVSLAGLSNWQSLSEAQAANAPPHGRFPIRYPRLGASDGSYEDTAPRVYELAGRRAYRLSVRLSDKEGAYYGIQGMGWRHPPILDAPHRTIVSDRRKLDLYFDGSKLGIVAYRTPSAVYWVKNTLTHDLTKAQMLAIARSLYILPAP